MRGGDRVTQSAARTNASYINGGHHSPAWMGRRNFVRHLSDDNLISGCDKVVLSEIHKGQWRPSG